MWVGCLAVSPPRKTPLKTKQARWIFLVGWKYMATWWNDRYFTISPIFSDFFLKNKGVPLGPFQKAIEIGAQVVVAKKFDQMDIWWNTHFGWNDCVRHPTETPVLIRGWLSASRYVSSISNPVWSSQEVLKSIIVNNGFTTNQSMFFDIFWVVSEMMVFLHVPKWRKKVTNDPLGLTSGSVTQKIGELNCNAFWTCQSTSSHPKVLTC